MDMSEMLLDVALFGRHSAGSATLFSINQPGYTISRKQLFDDQIAFTDFNHPIMIEWSVDYPDRNLIENWVHTLLV